MVNGSKVFIYSYYIILINNGVLLGRNTLGLVYLRKELEVTLIRNYVDIGNFVNEAVREKIEKEINNNGNRRS